MEHNAWDQEDMSEDMLQDALAKIKIQEAERCLDPESFDRDPCKFWDSFYQKNSDNFFKDRNWLSIEFPELFDYSQNLSDEPFVICELGCGAGNTVFPFLDQSKTLGHNVFAYACDYSSEAVNVVKSHPKYNPSTCLALQYDITSSDIPSNIRPGSIDVCICIFVLSAINPRDWNQVAANIFKLLKPNGLVLLRDYARYDLAQIRMKNGRLLQENFYRRGDGTRCYFFTLDELEGIFKHFEILQNALDKRLLKLDPGEI